MDMEISKKKKRKKASKKKIKAKSKVNRPVSIIKLDGPRYDEEDRMHFSSNDLMMYDLAEHKLANVNQAIQLKAQAANEATHAYQQTIQQLKVETNSLRVEQDSHTDRLKEIREAIESEYVIDMGDVTFDDGTGLIHKGSSYVFRGQRKK